MKLDRVKLRFVAMTAARIGSEKTRRQYWNRFQTFATCEDLTRYTRRQLSGNRGRELLIAHHAHVSARSRTFVMCTIKKVWTRGLDLPWPLEKDDLPRPPKPRRGVAPRREYVARWVEAARREKDVYERSWFLVEMNGGLRPIDQQAELRIGDLAYGPSGDLIGIRAEAAEHGFKREADVRQLLPDEATAAIRKWLGQHPNPSPGSFIWPFRDARGRVEPGRMATAKTTERMRRHFVARNRLPWLTSKDMRHFARTVLNDSGMPKVERHYWQGHSADRADMDEQYGDRLPEETFEAQRRALPQGVLGTFLRATPTDGAVPVEVGDVWARLVAGDIDSLEAAMVLKDLVRAHRRRRTAIVSEIVKP